MDELVYLLLAASFGYIGYLKGKGKQIHKDERTKEQIEYEKDYSEHIDSLLNYTPEKAYRKVKHG